MTNLPLDAAAGRTAAELVHHKLTATPAGTTVAEIRAFFAASESRRLAVLVDRGGRFAGVLSREDADAAPDPDAPAASVARPGPTVAADAPAAEAREAALADPSRRVPVVGADGTLLGVVAIDKTLSAFCGTG